MKGSTLELEGLKPAALAISSGPAPISLKSSARITSPTVALVTVVASTTVKASVVALTGSDDTLEAVSVATNQYSVAGFRPPKTKQGVLSFQQA